MNGTEIPSLGMDGPGGRVKEIETVDCWVAFQNDWLWVSDRNESQL